jgi:mRNA interferase MazF
MPSTTGYKRGDVVLVPFPFTDLTSTKQRPALVVSSDLFNITHSDVIVAAITSQIPITLAADEFPISNHDLLSCGLPKASILKLSKIVTLHQRLIVKQIGALPQKTLDLVLIRIRAQF